MLLLRVGAFLPLLLLTSAAYPDKPAQRAVLRCEGDAITKVDTSKYYIEIELKEDGEPDKSKVAGYGMVVSYNPAKCRIEIKKENSK